MDIWEKFRVDSNPGPQGHQSNTLTTRLRPQLPNRWKIFGIYAVTYIMYDLLMYTIASPDPEGVNYLTIRVQFYANECNEGRNANP